MQCCAGIVIHCCRSSLPVLLSHCAWPSRWTPISLDSSQHHSHHVLNGQYSLLWLTNSHPVSVATHDDSEHAQFTQPFSATYNLHGSHLLPVQEVCPKGLTQLLHKLLVAIESCKQNCSPAILRERCKRGLSLYMKWKLVWYL